ncbi:hypothetical protein pdam_00003288 [Pocillopora damicornis]|uniref:RCC1-like domain-containing protein n=1 Tax=Pocillopora damicornis TaxID=46731 RepID=A0A3M6TIE9_POCDA|nr:hypothetical protein pdam_00003288 [Pocillopora damicornis]
MQNSSSSCNREHSQMAFELFELICLLRVRPRVSQQLSKDDIKRLPSIQQAAFHEDNKRNLMVLLCSNGSLLLRAEEKGAAAVVKQVSWYQNPAKAIRIITLDPSGSWLVCACVDGSLYILPVAGIVQLGEILFVDLRSKMMLATVEFKEGIQSFELMQDKQHETTSLLINTMSGGTVQMQLEYKSMRKTGLEQLKSPSSVATAMGYETLNRLTIPMESVFSGTGDLQDKIKPMPTTTSTGIIQFSVQYARNQVYDIDVENLPMFVYQLPPGTSNVLLTDRVIFTITHQEQSEETLLSIQSSQLAETSLSVPKTHQKTESSIIQTFVLPPGEKMVAMFQHPELVESVIVVDDLDHSHATSSSSGMSHTVDGVTLVTTSGVFKCRPKMSPEKLFLELAVNSADTSAADVLAITTGLDVNKLYEMAGDEALKKENFEHALELYHLSKCSFERRVAQFAKHGRVADILAHLRQALSKHSDVHIAERKQLSNLTLFCFIQQVLYHSGNAVQQQTLSEAFSQFLNDNFDYDELTALEQLSAYGLKNFMFDVAKARGLMAKTLDMLAQKGQFHLSCELQGKLASRGFTDIISRSANGAFIHCMDPKDAVSFLLSKPETILSHLKFILSHLTSLNEESLVHVARVLDPSRPSFRSLASKMSPPKQRTISGSSISSVLSVESTVSFGQEDTKQPSLQDLIELFLCCLLVLNHLRDDKLDADARVAALKCISGGDQASENSHGRKREGTVEFLCRPVRLSCGQQHSAVVSSSGDVYTWGRSQKGRLGHGDLIEEEGKSVPFRVEILHMHRINVLSVACGMEHTLALCSDGVYSWGSSEYGQLGQGDMQQQTRPVYITELSDKKCIAVMCGHYHSMALSADHRVWSWGWGVHGQLGVGSIEDALLPTHVQTLDEYQVTALAAGYSHSAVLTAQGQVLTFGGGLYGQLGLGTNSKQTLPVLVETLKHEKVYLICCGSFETRQEYRSKRSAQASLPSNATSHRLLPVRLDCTFSSRIKDVCCGNWHYMVVMESGQLYSWGYDDYGQLGLGGKMEPQMTPRLLHKLSSKSITTISVGAEFSVAMDTAGYVWLGLDFGTNGVGKKEVFVPCQLTSLPPMNRKASISSEHSLRSDLNTDVDIVWDLPDLSSIGNKSVPYGREALSIALHQLSDQYPAQPLIRHCLDIRDYLAAAVIYETVGDWPQVLGYSLRFLNDCYTSASCDGMRDKLLSSAFDIMHHVIRKFTEAQMNDEHSTQQTVWLLQEVLQFWTHNNLPFESLEGFLLKNLDVLGYALSLLLIRDHFLSTPNKDAQGSGSAEINDTSKTLPQNFTVEFFNKVVTHVVHQLQEDDLGEEYASDLKSVLARYSSTEDSPTSKDETFAQPFAQLDAGIRLKDFHAAQKHLWQEILDNIKKDLDKHPYIALSMTAAATIASAAVSQQRGWRGEGELITEPQLQADVVLFTCNHHFPRVYFQEFILPEFQQRMSELVMPLKHTTKLLLKYYSRQDGFLPTACPICVYNSIRIEQMEIAAVQSGNIENMPTKPWDI